MRTLTTLLANSQKLDGGAMFGNAPRALWSRWMQPDAENRIDLGCRALLVRDGERNVLVEAGIGAFFPPALRQRYGVQEERHVLLDSLAAVGLDDADIDVVLLTHLHFDHAGGLLAAWEEGQPARLLFPNAHFVSGRRHWQRARQPHPRDRASFVPELLDLLQASGRLELLDDGERSAHLGEGWRFHFSEGHTPGQMLPEIAMPDGPVVFSGDLIPGAPWVHLPLTMGYDRFPEGLIEEKERLLDSLIARNGRLVFTHDPCVAMGRVRRDEQERYSLYDTLERVENLEA
ncbi:TPA: MBL fold metallo-hydrolase [Pseudomonas aeruginosa]|uniref:MBL fold metallo-hydrolase n=1 Tax=Pseudomonas aeruginosa TaxID=287 RepID=UPI0003D2E11E|nr:MBL fold metallo-hydrolase [Pseudomonas aeruginosa]ETD82895.1 beta-lactamase [Pseudomonas aeruginosa VRFPA06]MBO8287211.1 MBL fold metallo-hydrolase [Pseudomonas aeruginosa]MBR7204875.1 MBL fold metallo-hydrolase [Pseudomonas aeruginosa]MDG3609632.1 MBL fold metallo-hydrolase [Pseudomonas aeruginosa]MDG3618410.1 MBL fold metallo-hydrolase [Pseudomonas aeruginosa]